MKNFLHRPKYLDLSILSNLIYYELSAIVGYKDKQKEQAYIIRIIKTKNYDVFKSKLKRATKRAIKYTAKYIKRTETILSKKHIPSYIDKKYLFIELINFFITVIQLRNKLYIENYKIHIVDISAYFEYETDIYYITNELTNHLNHYVEILD